MVTNSSTWFVARNSAAGVVMASKLRATRTATTAIKTSIPTAPQAKNVLVRASAVPSNQFIDQHPAQLSTASLVWGSVGSCGRSAKPPDTCSIDTTNPSGERTPRQSCYVLAAPGAHASG